VVRVITPRRLNSIKGTARWERGKSVKNGTSRDHAKESTIWGGEGSANSRGKGFGRPVRSHGQRQTIETKKFAVKLHHAVKPVFESDRKEKRERKNKQRGGHIGLGGKQWRN